MRKCLSLLLAAILLLCLCACRSSQSGSTQPTDPPVTTQPATEAVTEPPVQSILVTAPLEIRLDPSEMAEELEMELVEDYCFLRIYPGYDCFYAPHTSAFGHITVYPEILELDVPAGTITYSIRTNYGGLCYQHGNYAGQIVTVDKFIYWMGYDLIGSEHLENTEQPDRCWIDVVVMADGHIIGCAVFELIPWVQYDKGMTYVYRYSEYYPQVDGTCQAVTEAFVEQRLEIFHQYAEEKIEVVPHGEIT